MTLILGGAVGEFRARFALHQTKQRRRRPSAGGMGSGLLDAARALIARILVCLFTLVLLLINLSPVSLVFLIPFDRAPEVILDGRHGRLQTRCGVRYEIARLRLGRVDWMDSRMSA